MYLDEMETWLWFVTTEIYIYIYFLWTIHEIKEKRIPRRGRNEIPPTKLSFVNDYNKYVGGVDRNDAFIDNYTCVRRTFKGTVKVVMHFTETVLNAFI